MDVNSYEFFQRCPTKALHGGERIDLGGRRIEILHTPAQASGHLCCYEATCSYLFTGDVVYLGTLPKGTFKTRTTDCGKDFVYDNSM
ncbi:MAG: MBL fold metallo-hydrolase [Clostridia bacterium]